MNTNHRMKHFKRVIYGLILFASVFYALPFGLLQISSLQKRLSVPIAAALDDKFGTAVHIGRIGLIFPNTIALNDVHIADRSQETLFCAGRLTADINPLSLLRKQWCIHSMRLHDWQVNLSRETGDAPLNAQYILDAFADTDSTKNNPLNLQIKTIVLRNGSFSYREKDAPETTGVFNPKSFGLTDIASRIKVRALTGDTLNMVVNRLKFKEKTGFAINRLTFDLQAGKERASVNRLSLKLKNTSLTIRNAIADYNPEPDGNRFANTAFRLTMDHSDIYLKDIRTFVPLFSQFDDKITISGYFSGTPDTLHVENFRFGYYDLLTLKTNADIGNLFNASDKTLFINARIEDSFLSPAAVEQFAGNFGKTAFELPAAVREINSLNFQGNVNGSPDSLTADGTFAGDIGTLAVNVEISGGISTLKGEIASPCLNMATLTGNRDFGDADFQIGFDMMQQTDGGMAGDIDGNIEKMAYKGYTYHNISLNGHFTPESFTGLLNLDSPEGKLAAKGFARLQGAVSAFEFTAKASRLRLDRLHLTPQYKNTVLSFEVATAFTGNSPDNLMGNINFNDIRLETDKGGFHLDRLALTSVPSESGQVVTVESDILNGQIHGTYSFASLIPELTGTLSQYLPSLFEPEEKKPDTGGNLFSFHFTVEDITQLSGALELPFILQEQTHIGGHYSSVHGIFAIDADISRAQIGKANLKDLKISAGNTAGEALLNLSGSLLPEKGRPQRFSAHINTADDHINARMDWAGASGKYYGDLNMTASFSKDKKKPLCAHILVKQSDFVFNDSVWTLYPTEIYADSSSVRIKHLLAAHNDQFVKINGAVTRDPDEQLFVELNKVNLDYIFRSLQIEALEFGGTATGFVDVKDLYQTRKVSTHLDVNDFSFNGTVVGNLDLTGRWNDKSQGVILNGRIYENNATRMDINGVIYPGKELLAVDFDASGLNAAFLRKYLNNVVQNISGSLTGRLHLFGDLNDPVIEGAVYAENCRFGIDFLNTTYTFSDTVRCYPDEIRADSIRLFDEHGRKALANGYAHHNLFKDFNYAATVSFNDFLIFNADKTQNPLFYGTAFGNGTVNLYGTDDVTNIDITMQNTGNTKITLNFMGEPDIADSDFIHFVKYNGDSTEKTPPAENSAPVNNKTDIRLNLMIDATPQATIEILTDPISGDKISAYGAGNIHILYGTKSPLKVLGAYTIERGKYTFSFQQLIYRNFDIREGSSVSFHGDLSSTELNVSAAYKLTANLGDLHPQLIEQQQRVNTTVNCLLNLNGHVNHPSVTFDLELPNSTPELNREVKNYIRTDDMMNRQIFYLLVLNSFYPSSEYVGNSTRTGTDMSLFTSALSTQISNILDAFTDKIHLVGTKFYQSSAENGNSTEMEILLSGSLLNNRLIINGNFGYRDNLYLDGNNQRNNFHWIGDFDLEYKLTEKGGIRLKFFNHYNYRNYYNLTPEMTQGLGIIIRKDFNRFSEFSDGIQ